MFSYFVIEDAMSDPADLTCGVPQGSILGTLLFLLYVNDMHGAVNCDLLLYVDDSCLISQDSDSYEIEKNLETNFNILCDWCIDNKLSIHLGEDKTKCIIFTGKNRPKEVKINIKHKIIVLKQFKSVVYLGCTLAENNSGEDMAIEVIKKINKKLKFLWRKHKFLNFDLRRVLFNAIIEPHFDYDLPAWYTNISKKVFDKLQVCQNKCICFCLHLDMRAHVGLGEFEKKYGFLSKKELNKLLLLMCLSLKITFLLNVWMSILARLKMIK